MTRPRALVALAVLGTALIAAPVVFQMFSRAPKGATMMDEFRPFMTDARLDGFQRDIRVIDDGVREGRPFAARYQTFAAFRRDWGPIHADMKGLLDTIQANAGNYRAVAALPSFTLFPWFFVIPGALLLGLVGVLALRPGWWGPVRWILVALGVGLMTAPVALQMFDRAPKGARMMTAFRDLETRRKVETIQGYFGAVAVGQGAVRLQILPALERSGLTRAEIGARYPGLSALDRRWVHILGDLTPMIGVMSDNVSNYQAVAALPSFALFPWFFVLPGLLVVGLALIRHPPTPRSTMTRRLIPWLGLVALAALVPGAGPASAGAKAEKLTGTFRLAPGRVAGGKASGSYIRLVYPGGSLKGGKFFENPDSSSPDKTYTLLRPGRDGGLVTGRYQAPPNPPFDGAGNASAGRIAAPQSFAGIKFSISTSAHDPQTKRSVPAPSIQASGGRLSGQVQAISIEWNKLHFNQGSPKPGGARPGLTANVSGRYDARTHSYALAWASHVVGGPFNGFTGYWHLEGTFRPR